MIRKSSLLLSGLVVGVIATFTLTNINYSYQTPANAAAIDTYRQLNLFGDVFEKIRSDYVEEPEDSQLVESAINGMLSALDPHSAYLTPKSFRDMQVQTSGEFGGLGIEVTMEEGLVKVVSPIDDTPAHRAGILAGDFITHIDGEAVLGLTLNQAVAKMRGKVDTDIHIRVAREGLEDPLEITITRAIIKIQSVRSRVEEDVGYIRITSFNQQTIGGLQAAIAEIDEMIPAENHKGYVLDLRNNPGGLLDQAVAVSNAFLNQGEIVSTRSRNPEDTQRYNASAGDLTNGKPVIVVINGGSASASEIVAGALQDHRRATLLGTKSFGKGSVQTVIPIGPNNNSGAIRLTTARYYTPSGRSIQAKGIDPDIMILPDVPEELRGRGELRTEDSLRGHLEAEGEAEESDVETTTQTEEEEEVNDVGSQVYVPSEPEEDKQLNHAYALLRGLTTDEAFPPDPNNTTIPN